MTFKTTTLRDAIVFALAAGAATIATVGVAHAQDAATEPTTDLDRIQVTGSRIRRAEIEGPQPITVVSRADMDAAGEISVADFLRNNVYNSFGSVRESSGSATGSQATISLRGLGAAYTLVLLDGRRITPSGALAGTAANINMIPTSAIERIEILREGAAAVYGSDAIGGVINIITRRDYEGASISLGYETPKVGPNGTTGSASAGISSDRGNVTFILDHQEREMMYNREIKDIVIDAGQAWAYSAYNSSAGFFSGSTGLVSMANCDQFENSVRTSPTSCGFDHGATSANESSLRRNALLVNGTYDITNNTSMFFRGLTSETKSLGVYASAPVDNSGRGPGILPTIAADNPFNPYGVAGTLYYRFTPLGTRDSHRKDTLRDFMIGLRGYSEILGGSDWEVGVGYGQSAQASVNYNYGIGSALQAAIDSGTYNPFDPTHPSVAAAAPGIGHTVFVESTQTTRGIDGNISFELFEIGGRPTGFVTGFEYREDALNQTFDAQSAAGNVFGSAGAGTDGERNYQAVYFEALFPVLESLNLTVAGRYDDYSDVGSKFSPRVSLEFRPVDSLLVRGSWGKGFRAPSLSNLYNAPSSTNLNSGPDSSIPHQGGDELACNALRAYRTASGNAAYQPYPVDPCNTNLQYTWLQLSNPDLEPEESQNWGLGVVWSPTDTLSMALDYYDIEIENIIATIPRALAFRFGDDGVPLYGVTRGDNIVAPGGTVLPGPANLIQLPIVNGASQTARGLDFEANYRFETATAGTFSSKLQWSHTLEFDFTPVGAGTQERAGLFNFPRNRGQLGLGWNSGDWSATVIGNYIGSHANVGSATALHPSWTTVDMQVGVATPWNSRVTLGVRNVGNKMPPFSSALGFPFYNNSLYNIYGRTPYLRYEQNF
ncbi:TonB-dependent receptor plug domain-containing protein [Luteimonas saliphila]|uniref:TonB-dependent receptor plug domain-containing protein n=1 Tax=Luteimonas saliphila TaxID=2804919 RepID=UPI00192E25F4|nr:TonB-dependent receptor [Luteimonas saliphila]